MSRPFILILGIILGATLMILTLGFLSQFFPTPVCNGLYEGQTPAQMQQMPF